MRWLEEGTQQIGPASSRPGLSSGIFSILLYILVVLHVFVSSFQLNGELFESKCNFFFLFNKLYHRVYYMPGTVLLAILYKYPPTALFLSGKPRKLNIWWRCRSKLGGDARAQTDTDEAGAGRRCRWTTRWQSHHGFHRHRIKKSYALNLHNIVCQLYLNFKK